MLPRNFARIILLVAVSLSMALQACSSATSTENATPEPTAVDEEPVELQVVVLPFLSFAPFHIAQAEGYFSEQNLQVEFVDFEHDSDAIAPLVQGQIDVVAGRSDISFLSVMAQGADVKVVADKGHFDPAGCTTDAFMISQPLADANVTDVADLGGKFFSIVPDSVDGYITEKLLDQAGLTLDDIRAEDFPPFVEIDRLGEGTLDVVMTSEPWITRNLDAGVATVFVPLEELVPDFQAAVLMYGKSFLIDDPELGVRFMTAYLKAVQQYNEGKTDRNIEILQEALDLDAELLNATCWPQISDNGEVNVQSLLDYQNWAFEKGYLDNTISEEQLWDSTFIDEALENLDQ